MITSRGGIGEGDRREAQEGGAYVYLWLVHVGVWQKPTQPAPLRQEHKSLVSS